MKVLIAASEKIYYNATINNCRRQEQKKALIIGDSIEKDIKRWKISKKLKTANASTNKRILLNIYLILVVFCFFNVKNIYCRNNFFA